MIFGFHEGIKNWPSAPLINMSCQDLDTRALKEVQVKFSYSATRPIRECIYS